MTDEAGPGNAVDTHAQTGIDDSTLDRAERVAERLAVPVLIAALASVPAVFLTLFDGTAAAVGNGLNALSGGVLIAETVVLFAVSEDRVAWLRRHRWLVALAVVMVPAVVFAVGPVQLLRLVRLAGALRIVRVGRIVKAGRILRERAGLDEIWQRVIGWGISLLVAGFVAMVLIDPTSQSRQVLSGAWERVGVVGVLLAGGILATATWVVFTARQEKQDPMLDD